MSPELTLSPDSLVLWRWGWFALNATLLFTWAIDLVLVGFAWWVARRLTPEVVLVRGQNLLEVLLEGIQRQLRDIMRRDPEPYLPFLASLFLFIAVSNALTIVPGYRPPTGSLSTATALALCVFVAVPAYGIRDQGLAYFRHYIEPSVLMLPFNIIGELSRTLALAVRLFGNAMSGTLVVLVLLALAPLFFPVVMQALGLLTGLIQAYIFAVLAAVFIASGLEVQDERRAKRAAGPGGASHD